MKPKTFFETVKQHEREGNFPVKFDDYYNSNLSDTDNAMIFDMAVRIYTTTLHKDNINSVLEFTIHLLKLSGEEYEKTFKDYIGYVAKNDFVISYNMTKPTLYLKDNGDNMDLSLEPQEGFVLLTLENIDNLLEPIELASLMMYLKYIAEEVTTDNKENDKTETNNTDNIIPFPIDKIKNDT